MSVAGGRSRPLVHTSVEFRPVIQASATMPSPRPAPTTHTIRLADHVRRSAENGIERLVAGAAPCSPIYLRR
jgi:hypothetical protein